MEIVALARVALLESVIVKFPDNVTGAAFSVYEMAEFTLLKTGPGMISSQCQCLGWAHGAVG
jgi:hypothetical protein